MSKWNDLCRRLRLSLGWIAAQYWATPLIVAAGIAWTRLPDKYAWQVSLTLLFPLLLLAALLALEAGTMRSLLGSEHGRVRLLYGALSLIMWIAIAWAAWAILDWCSDQIYLWAGYLNSNSPANLRARVLSYQHLLLWITTLIWIVRWIVVPAKLIPHAVASTQWGWRLPWRKLIRLLLNWQWWLAVVIAALLGVALPSHFFTAAPAGSVSHQVWAVSIKLVGTWLLATTLWVLAFAWAAVLLARTPQPAAGLDEALFARLRSGKKWILGWAVLTAILMLFDFTMDALPEKIRSSGWVIIPFAVLMLTAALVLQVCLLRTMTRQEERQVRPIWAALSVLIWFAAAVGLWILVYSWHHVIAAWIIDWIIIPALLIPFAAASSRWGLRLPWRRILAMTYNWRWWTGVVVAVVLGAGLPELIKTVGTGGKTLPQGFVSTFWNGIPDLLTMAAWILLMGWFAALLAVTKPQGGAPASSSLPEPGDGLSRNA